MVDSSRVFTIERHVGLLFEARVLALKTVDDVREYAQASKELLARFKPRRMVLVADHRAAGLYSPEVTAALIGLFTNLNTQLVRAALISGAANPLLTLQIARLVREAFNPVRRAFTNETELTTWLDDVLSAPERERLREFLRQSTVRAG